MTSELAPTTTRAAVKPSRASSRYLACTRMAYSMSLPWILATNDPGPRARRAMIAPGTACPEITASLRCQSAAARRASTLRSRYRSSSSASRSTNVVTSKPSYSSATKTGSILPISGRSNTQLPAADLSFDPTMDTPPGPTVPHESIHG